MTRLLEVAFDGGIGGGTVFHCIAKGEAGEGRVVTCLDGGKPGGWDWIASRGVVEVDKCIDAGESVGIVGLRRHCFGGWGRDSVRVRANGGFIVRGEQGVFVTVVVFDNKGKEPVTGFFRVALTFKDAVAFMVLGNDFVLGEGDTEVCIA